MSTLIIFNESALFTLLEYNKKYFLKSKYSAIVEKADTFFESGRLESCHEQLLRLPTKKKLFSELSEKLKGKSVYKTLKLLEKNQDVSGYTSLKGLSSLLTHCLIECEQGNIEYRMLLPEIYEKIGSCIYSI